MHTAVQPSPPIPPDPKLFVWVCSPSQSLESHALSRDLCPNSWYVRVSSLCKSPTGAPALTFFALNQPARSMERSCP